MPNTHYIKILRSFGDAVYDGHKNFEIRFNDRGYQKGDFVVFQVVEKCDDELLTIEHPLNYEKYMITYVLSGNGIENGFVVFGMKKVTDET